MNNTPIYIIIDPLDPGSPGAPGVPGGGVVGITWHSSQLEYLSPSIPPQKLSLHFTHPY